MEKTKILSSLFALLALSYSYTLHLGGSFANRNTVCLNTVFRAIQPWDSTCFYSTIFNQENLVSDVHYEKFRLDIFDKKQGLSPHIKWYKSRFYRQFKDHINVSDEQISTAHWSYMTSQPDNLEEHVLFLSYLSNSGSLSAAQKALNDYCEKYFTEGTRAKDAAKALSWLIDKNELEIDSQYCERQGGIKT